MSIPHSATMKQTITPAELRELTNRSKRSGANKYHAKAVGGHASKKEHDRANQLKLMQRAGLISGLREQVPFVLIPAQYGQYGKDLKGKPTRVLLERSCRYIADFVYTDADGNQVVEDTKGFRTPEYKIKRKLMLAVHGIKIKEI
ncbi:MAG: DUF1064 domain-containing protein [Staphylococcus sp.]|nr:DUF1064 domain-containing protein [Staphylococcus sp.]